MAEFVETDVLSAARYIEHVGAKNVPQNFKTLKVAIPEEQFETRLIETFRQALENFSVLNCFDVVGNDGIVYRVDEETFHVTATQNQVATSHEIGIDCSLEMLLWEYQAKLRKAMETKSLSNQIIAERRHNQINVILELLQQQIEELHRQFAE